MYTLFLDTSCDRGFLALAQDEKLLFQKYFGLGLLNSKELVPAVTELLSSHSIEISDLKCIGVGVGPGSYTGIRVGVAFARGLTANRLPLITFSSLDGFITEEMLFASVIPARSGGIWAKKRQWKNGEIVDLSPPRFYTPPEYGELLDVNAMVTPCPFSISHPQLIVKEQALSFIAKLIESKYAERNFSKEKIEILYLPRCPSSI